jgi:hypothetical protein
MPSTRLHSESIEFISGHYSHFLSDPFYYYEAMDTDVSQVVFFFIFPNPNFMCMLYVGMTHVFEFSVSQQCYVSYCVCCSSVLFLLC